MDVISKEVKKILETRGVGSFAVSFKKEKEAETLKKQGNGYFKTKQLSAALHCYTKAAFLSPWPSEEKQKITSQLIGLLEPSKRRIANCFFPPNKDTGGSLQSTLLALCIGNRSAVLKDMHRYQECMADIELALSLGYPSDSQDKLHRRQAYCISSQSVRETSPVGDSDHHVSKSITCDSSASKGRFIRATRDIEAGEVVMCEKAYVAVLNPDHCLTHCSYCFQQTSSLIPCCWCVSEGYCSVRCKEGAWIKYHWLECRILNIWIKADWTMRLALRMLISASSNSLQGVLSLGLDEKGNDDMYLTILSLISHEKEFTDPHQKAMLSKMADLLVEGFGATIESYISGAEGGEEESNRESPLDRELRKIFHHHLLQLRCNSHSIRAVVEIFDGGGGGEENVKFSKELCLGTGIFPTASLFNHSCYPNIIFRFQGSTVEAVATRTIRKGEEANNCYGPQLGRMRRADRMAKLQRKFFFLCSCPACDRSDPELEYREVLVDAYLCPTCSGAVKHSDSNWKCIDCQTQLKSRDSDTIKKLVSENEKMFGTTENEDGEVDLPLLLKCHSLQTQVLHKHNLKLAKTNDTLAQIYASNGEFARATEYCGESCSAVEAVHGSHSIELANELHKLAQLHLNCGEFIEAAKTVTKALPLMQIYNSSNHPDIIELQRMKQHLFQSYYNNTSK